MYKYLLLPILFLSSIVQAQDVDVIQYQISIQVNDRDDSLRGKTGIVFSSKGSNAEVELDLVSVNTDGKGMFVDGVYDGHNKPLRFVHENDRLRIFLRNDVKDTLQFVSVLYRGIPDNGLIIAKNKFGDRTFFSDNWPNRARHWLPCNDRPDDKASIQLHVTAPAHYQVISNGVKRQEKLLANKLKQTCWEEETPLPTKVIAVGIARFAVKTYTNHSTPIPVSAWVYPRDSTKGFYDYALTPKIVQFLSDYIGPFPFQKLANVQSTTMFGGMENASCIFYAESSVTGNRNAEDLMVHEIAHQWFGNSATEKSFAHVWLSEGFATYLTHLYREKKYGKEALHKRMEKDRMEVLQFSKTSARAVVDSTDDLMSLLNANSYQKGGWILHMLRSEVGDDVFQKIIRTYYDRYKYCNAETKAFQQIAEAVSGKDLEWFFDQWLHRPGMPKLLVQKIKEGDTLTLKISQSGNLYRLPLTIHIRGNNGRIIKEKLLLTGRETVSTWKGKPSEEVDVILDPDCTLLFEEAKK